MFNKIKKILLLGNDEKVTLEEFIGVLKKEKLYVVCITFLPAVYFILILIGKVSVSLTVAYIVLEYINIMNVRSRACTIRRHKKMEKEILEALERIERNKREAELMEREILNERRN